MIKNKFYFLFLTLLMNISFIKAQEQYNLDNKNIFRLNILNPSLEYEIGFGENTAISVSTGIGYGGSYRELEVSSADGFVYVIAPFLDIQYKFLYNREKRYAKKKNIFYNSGNYISVRGIARFSSIAENIVRTDNSDFAIGPTWGFQRSFNKYHFLFDVGPQYYFDKKGNSGFFPIMLQFNIGFNLSSK